MGKGKKAGILLELLRNIDALFCSKMRNSRFRGTRILYFLLSRHKNQ